MRKLSLGWVALVAAGVLTTTPTFAQEEPPAEPAPPAEPPPTAVPPAEPPPATPPTGAQPQEPPKVPPPAGQPGQPGFTFGAGTSPQADQGQTGAAAPAAPAAKEEKLPWRLTTFGWDHSATSDTVGIGKDRQSDNPTYEMSFILQPRYYIWEAEDPTQAISLRARLDLIREFTNSDSTTKEGEWTFSDLSVFPQYGVTVYKEGDDLSTDLGLRLPTLAFPTSKVSANNGRILQVGAMLIEAQKVPVLGSSEPVLQNFTLTLRQAYSHWFTKATQPVNDDLARVRMGPDGRSVPGDTLSGAANANHNVTFDVIGALQVHERVTWTNWFQWGLAWKYRFDQQQEVCGNVATGCVTVDSVNDPNNHTVTTLFNTEVAVDVTKEFEVDVGYANLTGQIGSSGERRNIFYSPDARVYITFVAHLDEIYLSATGSRKSETAGSGVSPKTNAQPKKQVASLKTANTKR